MELGSWALISAPSILGLLPLLVFIVLALRGVENLSALIISVALGAILLGWDSLSAVQYHIFEPMTEMCVPYLL